MTFVRRASIILVAVWLTGCTRAPTEAALTADLQMALDANYAPGLVEVVEARRSNDFPFVWSGGETDVPYHATLRLRRDHRFGTWTQINAGVLFLLLGTTAEDVSGLKASGNVAGDELTVAGRLAYQDGQLARTRAPDMPHDAEQTQRFVLFEDASRAMRQKWQDLGTKASSSHLATIVREWRGTMRAVGGATARKEGGFAVVADRGNAAHRRLGRAAAREAADEGVAFANLAANSTQEALELLRGGRATAAVIRNTDAALAVSGLPPYKAAGPYRLSALATLYPEPVHVIVSADSLLGSPADLFGKHVGVVGTARVDTVDAEAILRGHGVPISALAAPLVAVPPTQAFAQLNAGAFDALILTSPLPHVALYANARRHPLRLLPFDSDAIAFLTSGLANYIAITVPARSYPGQIRPLASVATVAMLVSVDSVPAQEAADLLRLMLTRVNYLQRGSPAGAMISRDEARLGITLPPHDGATLFFDFGPKS